METLNVSADHLKERNLVAQSNSLIQAQYRLTPLEFDLVFAMASLINPDDKEFLRFVSTTNELAKILGVDPKNSAKEFDRVTSRLLTRILRVETEKGWIKFQWVSEAQLEGSTVSLKFHDNLKPVLLELKKRGHFTQYRLKEILWMKSFYTKRVFQILREYEGKNIKSFKISLADFRTRVLGEKSKSYPLYKNFRNKVLDVAQKELSTLDENGFHRSKLNFELTTHRTGRKITDLEFKIIHQATAPKNKVIDIDANEEDPETDLQKKLLSYGVSKANSVKFIAEHTEKYLLEKIAYLEQANKKEPIKNTGAWLTKAIKEDWQGKSTASTEAEKQAAKVAREKLLEERRVLDFEKKKKSAEIKVKNEFLESLSEEEQTELLEELKKDSTNGSLVSKLDSGITRSMLPLHIPDYENKVKSLMN